METFYQNEDDIIDPSREMHYALLSSFRGIQFPHSHDFYEFSLLIEGTQLLEVNGHRLQLQAGTLVLMRPNDVHSRAYLTAGRHINIAISSQIAQAMFAYLGEFDPIQALLTADNPPYASLSKQETIRMQSKLNELCAVHMQDVRLQRTKLRILVMDLFVHHFLQDLDSNTTQDDWFNTLLVELERPEHLAQGLPALTKLSNRTHEHLCREFRKRLDCTPTHYINDLRLNYVANFLRHSDLNIIDISLDAGFENTSHFYHLFKEKYGCSPKQFRNGTKSAVIF